MQARRILSVLFWPLLLANAADTVAVRGIVHDPQHRPLPGAQIVVRNAAASKNVTSDGNGEFQIDAVPEGAYTIGVSAGGFRPVEQQIRVAPGRAAVLHFQLELAPVTSSVEVSEAASKLNA